MPAVALAVLIDFPFDPNHERFQPPRPDATPCERSMYEHNDNDATRVGTAGDAPTITRLNVAPSSMATTLSKRERWPKDRRPDMRTKINAAKNTAAARIAVCSVSSSLPSPNIAIGTSISLYFSSSPHRGPSMKLSTATQSTRPTQPGRPSARLLFANLIAFFPSDSNSSSLFGRGRLQRNRKT